MSVVTVPLETPLGCVIVSALDESPGSVCEGEELVDSVPLFSFEPFPQEANIMIEANAADNY